MEADHNVARVERMTLGERRAVIERDGKAAWKWLEWSAMKVRFAEEVLRDAKALAVHVAEVELRGRVALGSRFPVIPRGLLRIGRGPLAVEHDSEVILRVRAPFRCG